MPLERDLIELDDRSNPITTSRLTNFSDLSPEEVELFKQGWGRIRVERRRQVIHRLVALAESNAKLNFDSVFQICLQDPDAIVRAKAIQGLWECEDCALIASLIELLTKDKAVAVRASATGALGKFALLAEQGKVHPRHLAKITTALLSAIEAKKEKVEVKCRAIEAIAPLGIPQVKEVIYTAYQSNTPQLQASAIYAMGKSGDPFWLPILLKELNNHDAEIRFEAARACGELGEEESVSYLTKSTYEPDAQVRVAATEALGQIGGTGAKQALRQCLRHPDEQVRQAAREAWSELGLLEEEHPPSFEIEPGGE